MEFLHLISGSGVEFNIFCQTLSSYAELLSSNVSLLPEIHCGSRVAVVDFEWQTLTVGAI